MINMITEYKIIPGMMEMNGTNGKDYLEMLKEFENRVAYAIAEGWQPLGGVSTTPILIGDTVFIHLYQSVVK